MKTLLYTLFVLSLFSITAFPQDRSHKGELPERFNTGKLREIQKLKSYGPEGFSAKEDLIRQTNSNGLQNTLKEFNKEEKFNAQNSRTTTNKTLLSNGFILIEELIQTWNGTAWVNSYKDSYTYDVNNNQTEWLSQIWNGTAWVNSV